MLVDVKHVLSQQYYVDIYRVTHILCNNFCNKKKFANGRGLIFLFLIKKRSIFERARATHGQIYMSFQRVYTVFKLGQL